MPSHIWFVPYDMNFVRYACHQTYNEHNEGKNHCISIVVPGSYGSGDDDDNDRDDDNG